jgi:hypothetical protein
MGRALVIDGRFSGLLDQFDKYLVILRRPTLVGAWDRVRHFLASHGIPWVEGRCELLWWSEPLEAELATRRCVPHCLNGKLGGYAFEYNGDYYLETESRERIGFDFHRDYPEPVLVHQQCGGGNLSFQAIGRFGLAADLSDTVARMRAQWPDYISVHVRNSDLRTDYQSLLLQLDRKHPRELVLVCSDDSKVKDFAAELFGSRLIQSTRTPDTGGKSLHYNPALDRYQQNRDLLVDLAMLACGRELWVTETKAGYVSGFGSLARHLNRNPRILRGFLGLQ